MNNLIVVAMWALAIWGVSTLNAQTLDIMECKKTVKVKIYNAQTHKVDTIIVPKNIIINEKNYCNKPFQRTEKNPHNRG